MVVTHEDRAVADKANVILKHLGLPQTASGERVVGWRSLLPVLGDRRGGRSGALRYAPEAPVIAAQLARANDRSRPFPGEALMSAFGCLPQDAARLLPERAIKNAFDAYLWRCEDYAAGSWEAHREANSRSEVKRSLRVPMPHPRRGDAVDLSRTVLGAILGTQQETRWAYLLRPLVDSVAPNDGLALLDASPATEDRLPRLIRRMALARLRQVAKRSTIDEFAWGAHAARVLTDYASAIDQIVALTDSSWEMALESPEREVFRLLLSFHRRFESRPGLDLAILGLLLVAAQRRPRKALREAVALRETHLRAIVAVVGLVGSLEPKWRSAFAPHSGLEVQRSFSPSERKTLANQSGRWLVRRPEDCEALVAVGIALPPDLDPTPV